MQCLKRFTNRHARVASDVRCSLIFMSMAADALSDKNYGQCRKFMRAMYFMEAYAQIGNIFLEFLHNTTVADAVLGESFPDAITIFLDGLEKSKSVKKGIYDIRRIIIASHLPMSMSIIPTELIFI